MWCKINNRRIRVRDYHQSDAPETFRCALCGRDTPWAQGAADDRPELCDGCYAKKVASPLDGDAQTHHHRDMAKAVVVVVVRLRVTTKELGVREVEWHGRFAERMAKFYTSLWEREGHKVERF
jgi:hypothetical protein